MTGGRYYAAWPKAWCRDLPLAHVPAAGVLKRLTIILPYYENPAFLLEQIARWRTFPPSIAGALEAIVVDDGSPTPATRPLDPPFPLRLFRIGVDIRWNWLAARNIGAHYAREGWILLTDMDHVLPAETAAAILEGAHHPGIVYGFSRREHTGELIPPHSASFLMTRAMFWRIGGYDEALAGHYGTDGEYRRRLVAHAPIQILPDLLERHEYQGDSSTARYLRKQPQDAAVRQLIAARRPGWRPRVLSFPHAEVA